LFMMAVITALFAVMGWALVRPGLDYVFIFTLGGIVASVYSVALTLLGEQFRGAALASATATFTLMWNVAAALGPPLTGQAMDSFGPQGLVWFMALLSISAVPLGYRVWRRQRRKLSSTD